MTILGVLFEIGALFNLLSFSRSGFWISIGHFLLIKLLMISVAFFALFIFAQDQAFRVIFYIFQPFIFLRLFKITLFWPDLLKFFTVTFPPSFLSRSGTHFIKSSRQNIKAQPLTLLKSLSPSLPLPTPFITLQPPYNIYIKRL